MNCKKFQSPKIFLQRALGYKCIYFLCLIFQLFTLFLYLADGQVAHSWIQQAVCFSYISSKHKIQSWKSSFLCWGSSQLKSSLVAIFKLRISSCGPRWLLHFCRAASKKGKRNKRQAYSFSFNITVTSMFILYLFFFNPSFEDYVIVFYSFWKSYFADNGSEALVERELKSYGDLIIGRESCKKKITELLCWLRYQEYLWEH